MPDAMGRRHGFAAYNVGIPSRLPPVERRVRIEDGSWVRLCASRASSTRDHELWCVEQRV